MSELDKTSVKSCDVSETKVKSSKKKNTPVKPIGSFLNRKTMSPSASSIVQNGKENIKEIALLEPDSQVLKFFFSICLKISYLTTFFKYSSMTHLNINNKSLSKSLYFNSKFINYSFVIPTGFRDDTVGREIRREPSDRAPEGAAEETKGRHTGDVQRPVYLELAGHAGDSALVRREVGKNPKIF